MKIKKSFGMIGLTKNHFDELILPHLDDVIIIQLKEGKRGISVTLELEEEKIQDVEHLINSAYTIISKRLV